MLSPQEREYCNNCDCSKCKEACLTCFTCPLKNKNIFACEKR